MSEWFLSFVSFKLLYNVDFNFASPSGPSPAEIVGSNPTGGTDVLL